MSACGRLWGLTAWWPSCSCCQTLTSGPCDMAGCAGRGGGGVASAGIGASGGRRVAKRGEGELKVVESGRCGVSNTRTNCAVLPAQPGVAPTQVPREGEVVSGGEERGNRGFGCYQTFAGMRHALRRNLQARARKGRTGRSSKGSACPPPHRIILKTGLPRPCVVTECKVRVRVRARGGCRRGFEPETGERLYKNATGGGGDSYRHRRPAEVRPGWGWGRGCG